MKKQQLILGIIVISVIATVGFLVNRVMQLETSLQSKSQVNNKVKPTTSAEKQGTSVFAGGSQLTIQLKPTPEHPMIIPQDVSSVRRIIESRIKGLGLSDVSIQSTGNDRLLVQLPGVMDSQQAERVLGGTAQLEFRQQKPGTEGQLAAEIAVFKTAKEKQDALKKGKSADKQAIAANNIETEKQKAEISKLFNKAAISGQNIEGANPQPLSGNRWEVAIEFNSTGSDAFAKLTKNLAGTGRAIGVFLDNEPISTPTVGAQFATTGITGGKAVLTGNFTAETANDLSVQLRGGSLPVPVEIVENRTILPK